MALGIQAGRIAASEPLGASGADDALPFVMPAFVDAHWHLLWAGLEASSLMLDRARSREELLAAVRESAREGEGLLRAEKFDESDWPDPRLPTLAELDEAAGQRPVLVRRVCGHSALASSALLRMLPPELAAEAAATGRLTEQPVLDFERWFPRTAEELRAAIRHAVSVALAHGVTAVATMEPLAHARLLAAGPLGIDVRYAVFGNELRELEGWLRAEPEVRASAPLRTRGNAGAPQLLGAKLFLDGGLGAGTAALAAGYRDGSRGQLLLDDDALDRLLDRVAGLGLMPVVHAIGGRALEQLAKASARLFARHPEARALGVRVEHAEELEPAWQAGWERGVHRFCMQPNFVRRWQLPGGLYEQRLAETPARRLNPFALVRRHSYALGFGSDGMPFGPLWGLTGATEHPVPELGLSRHEALEAYTLGAAELCGMDDLAVPITPGRQADLLVLSGNPLTVPQLDELEIVAVVRRGAVVRGDPGLLRSSARPASP